MKTKAMHTLYLNTATKNAAVAVYKDCTLLHSKCWGSHQDESEKLLPMIEELLSEASLQTENIHQLIVCVGPGGFTSTRVGLSVANTWSFAQQIPVASVSVFELYSRPADLCFVTSNPSEGWFKKAGSLPEFGALRDLSLAPSFSFTGLLHDESKAYLMDQGGNFISQEEQLPQMKNLHFSQQILKPWYYKQANITFSDKIKSL